MKATALRIPSTRELGSAVTSCGLETHVGRCSFTSRRRDSRRALQLHATCVPAVIHSTSESINSTWTTANTIPNRYNSNSRYDESEETYLTSRDLYTVYTYSIGRYKIGCGCTIAPARQSPKS
jgi:hypothetical protein